MGATGLYFMRRSRSVLPPLDSRWCGFLGHFLCFFHLSPVARDLYHKAADYLKKKKHFYDGGGQ